MHIDDGKYRILLLIVAVRTLLPMPLPRQTSLAESTKDGDGDGDDSSIVRSPTIQLVARRMECAGTKILRERIRRMTSAIDFFMERGSMK